MFELFSNENDDIKQEPLPRSVDFLNFEGSTRNRAIAHMSREDTALSPRTVTIIGWVHRGGGRFLGPPIILSNERTEVDLGSELEDAVVGDAVMGDAVLGDI